MELSGKRMAILVENEYQDLEVWYPALRFREAGRRVTGFFSIKDDLVHAGANFEDAEVVRDGNLITSRRPEDLPERAGA